MAKILIIDDRASNRQFLTALLGYQKHELREASDGAEGLHTAREFQPDLIISDVLMPTMDGYEFVRQLRADPQIANTPVAFATAHYLGGEARALAEKCGVKQLIRKPSEPQEVLDAVAAALASPTVGPLPVPATEAIDREHLTLLTNTLAEKTDQLLRANEKLTALVELSTELSHEKNPAELLNRYCAVARDVVGAHWALVVLLDRDHQVVEHFAAAGLEIADSAALRSDLLQNEIFMTAVRERRTTCLSRAASPPEELQLRGLPRAESLVVAPICVREQVYGWLCLADKLGFESFTAEDEQLVIAIGSKMAVAHDNLRLYDDTAKYACRLEDEIAERKRAETVLAGLQHELEITLNSMAEGLYREGQAVPLREPDGSTLWHGIVSDISERKRAQQELWEKNEHLSRTLSDLQARQEELTATTQQLWQASKLVTVGELAASVAHELNHPLTTLGQRAEALLSQVPEDDQHRRGALEVISEEVDRMARLVNNLSQFSRRSHRQVSTVDLPQEVVNTLNVIDYHLRSGRIAVVHEFAESLPPLHADRQQLRQLFLNLITNASDAMPNGGTLTVRVSRAALDGAEGVAVDFADTGEGISPEHLGKIWDTFFTTKPEGKGTGLGLAICRRIVEEHKGQIQIESEPGRGTVIRMVFPVSEAARGTSH